MLEGARQSELVLKTSTNLPCFIWLLIRAPLSQTFPQNPELEVPVALWCKGRCSALRSSLKGHVLPDTGEHLLLHLACVCSPGVQCASCSGGTSEPVPLEIVTSRLLQGLLHEVTVGQPVNKVLVEDLPFKNSATASG